MRGDNTQGEILFYFFITQREFPVVHSPPQKKENLLCALCSAQALHSSVYYSASEDLRTKLSLPAPLPMAPWPQGDVNMFLLSDAMDRQVLGAGDAVFWAPFLLQSHFTACLNLDPLNPRFWPRPPNWSPWLRVSVLTQVSHGRWSFKGTSQKRPESFCCFSLPITGYNPSFFGAHFPSTPNGWPRRSPSRSRMSIECETGVHPWGIHPLDRWWREEGKRVIDARTVKFPFNPDLPWCWELLDLPFRSCHLTPSLLQCDTKWSSMNAPEVVQHMVPHFHKITSFLLAET